MTYTGSMGAQGNEGAVEGVEKCLLSVHVSPRERVCPHFSAGDGYLCVLASSVCASERGSVCLGLFASSGSVLSRWVHMFGAVSGPVSLCVSLGLCLPPALPQQGPECDFAA